MQLPSAIAAGSVAIALFAGGFAIGHGVAEDDSSKDKAQVAGQTFDKTAESTTTTTAVAAPQAPPTTQAPPAATTTTAKAAAPAAAPTPTTLQATVVPQAPTPTATQSTVVVNPECGRGTASAQVSSHTEPRTATAGTEYDTDVIVDVSNAISKPIQLDALRARATLEDGRVIDVVFNGAVGTIVQSGNTARFTAKINTGKSPAKTVSLSDFAFHTAGHPECPGRTA